jgi:hypothetical protein
MEKKLENIPIRGYHRTSKAWYSKNDGNIEVTFGLYYPDGGTDGEIKMEWVLLGNSLCARLKSFEDSWLALSKFTDLIHSMGDFDSKLISEDEFCVILKQCGFKDLTAYQHPYKKDIAEEVEMVTLTIPKTKAIELNLI